MSTEKRDLQAAKRAIAALEPEASESTRAEVLRAAPEIMAARARGVTWDRLAATLTENGFPITGRVLATYFLGWRKRGLKSTSSRPENATRERDAAPAALAESSVRVFNLPSVEDATADHPSYVQSAVDREDIGKNASSADAEMALQPEGRQRLASAPIFPNAVVPETPRPLSSQAQDASRHDLAHLRLSNATSAIVARILAKETKFD